MLSKAVKNESSGIVFGTFSFFGTLGTLLINKLGGYLYDRRWHYWPFIMTFGVFAVLIIVTLTMGLLRKIDV